MRADGLATATVGRKQLGSGFEGITRHTRPIGALRKMTALVPLLWDEPRRYLLSVTLILLGSRLALVRF